MKIISELTTEELHERILHATTELMEREVAKKYEGDMDAIAGVTANQQRAETIQRAREFWESNACDNTEYEVNHDSRLVLVYEQVDGGCTSGFNAGGSACGDNDIFNEHIHKAIALGKCKSIDIPQEFLDAAQPDELVVGMKVSCGRDFPRATSGPVNIGDVFIVVVDEIVDIGQECHIESPIAVSSTIIDDTNAEYEEV